MKRLYPLFALVLLLALAACRQAPEATPTVAPTTEAAPEETPTEVPPTEAPATEEPAPTEEAEPAAAHTPDPELIDRLWLWERRTPAGDGDVLEVPNPENYDLLFNEDGTFFVGLDCNRGGGSYATDGAGGLTMELGMTSLALCPEDSLEATMTEMFAAATAYRLEEDGQVLAIVWADESVDWFRLARAEALTADADLIDRVWQWTGREPADGEAISVPDPEAYTLTFNADGTFFVRLDCNNGFGSYTSAESGAIALELGGTTLALCPEASLAADMQGMFGPALTYAFEDDGQTLVFTGEDGTVDTFQLAGEETPSLAGAQWQWLGTTTPEEPVIVADASRYLITFNEDGTASITADCNQVTAEFTAEDGALNITPGATTTAACPEDSQGELFVQQLSNAALYFFQDGDLYIDLTADAGTMRLSELPVVDLPAPVTGEPTGVVNAPAGIHLRAGPGTNFMSLGIAPEGDSGTLIGVSVDGQWYVVDAPSFPGGRVWVSAAFVDATNADDLPVIPTPRLAAAVVGPTWLWASTTTGEGTTNVADPTRYAITFAEDGTAVIRADCNTVLATYTVDGQGITITPGPSTLMACPEDSQADAFVQQLGSAAIYFFQGNELFLDLPAGNTMRFMTSVATAPNPPITAGVSGVNLRVNSFGPAGAEQNIIPYTWLTVTFDGPTGVVSGVAGCNNYTGSFIAEGSAFSISPLATTMMLCEDPPGIMEQEAAFLAALQGATGYRWTQEHVNGTLVTTGQLFYTLPDGTSGVINLAHP